MQPVTDERSIGDLFSELAQETRTLVSQELELAKTEMSQKASKVGKSAGFVAVGGLVVYAGVIFMIAGIVLALAQIVPLWLSALLVGMIVAALGYLAVQKGLNDLKASNLKPERTLASLKQDRALVKEQAR